MFASQWFMTLFAYKFPLDLVFRIYDMVFVEGLEAVLKFALALLKRNETHLLELDFEHLLDFLKNGLFEEYKVMLPPPFILIFAKTYGQTLYCLLRTMNDNWWKMLADGIYPGNDWFNWRKTTRP
jgi:hypothetical protein